MEQQEKSIFLQLRLPPNIAVALRERAAFNRRSLNSQILFILERGIEADQMAHKAVVSGEGCRT